jgi:hypothetical protein
MGDSTARKSERSQQILNPHGRLQETQRRPEFARSSFYEEQLNRDPRWALSEGSRHFEEDSAVFKALRRIAKRLAELGIPYAVVGGMALFRHGLRRFTEDVDLLVTKENLKRIHEELSGLGYIPPFAKSKQLRDVELGVRIEFLTTGAFPGDGKKKPVAFPDPTTVSFAADGIQYIKLETLVELKLASGMTNPARMKDLTDVLELIKVLDLPDDFAEGLDPYVRDKYRELWKQARKRYVSVWRNKRLTPKANSIEEMISLLRRAADDLEKMRRDGVVLDDDGGAADDYARLVTTDPKIAEKYGLVDEDEYWDTGENDEEEPAGRKPDPEAAG